MKILQGFAYGPPDEVLKLTEVETAPLRPGEVRLKTLTAGLNFLDVMLCRGTYPTPVPPPFTPGVEVVGRIVESASTNAQFKEGQIILACPTLPDGCLAEYVTIDESLITVVPAGVDLIRAAALPVNYQTAWFALKQAGVKPGETVLIHAGAGGVGIAATQLSRAWDATVISTAGGPEKTALCLEQGAHIAIDYRHEDFVKKVEAATDDSGVDIVIDSVGGDTFIRSLDVLRFQGRIVPVGSASGNPASVDPMLLTARNLSVVGLSWGSAYPFLRADEVRGVYEQLFAMLGTSISPVINRVVDLEQVPAALSDLENRRTVGKIVVKFNDFMPAR